MAVKAVDLLPFQTPNVVIALRQPRPREEGWHEAPTWPLSDVDAETLATLCDEFRVEVFRKAGKPDPAIKGGA